MSGRENRAKPGGTAGIFILSQLLNWDRIFICFVPMF
jgi:hypothetical protein